jgi:hypothetical protein
MKAGVRNTLSKANGTPTRAPSTPADGRARNAKLRDHRPCPKDGAQRRIVGGRTDRLLRPRLARRDGPGDRPIGAP